MTSAAWLWVTVVFALSGPFDATASDDLQLRRCRVELIHDIEVPAKEAGLLVKLNVKEESPVAAGDVLALLGDQRARIAIEVAKFEKQAAEEQANNDINEKFAKKASEVASADYKKNLKANTDTPGAVPQIVLMEKYLTYQQRKLQIKQAEMERKVAGFTKGSKSEELKAAELALERRKIKSSIYGEVAELMKHAGEWVNAGDTVMRVVQMDKLYTKGDFDITQYSPGMLRGSKVTVVAHLADGEKSFTGTVTRIGTQVLGGKHTPLWAEVENRRENREWLLRPGMEVSMSIHLTGSSSAQTPTLSETTPTFSPFSGN